MPIFCLVNQLVLVLLRKNTHIDGKIYVLILCKKGQYQYNCHASSKSMPVKIKGSYESSKIRHLPNRK